mgnify:FL=1
MANYIKSQMNSDEAEASVIGPVMILALVLVAIVVIFGKLMASTERKGADVANCINTSTSFTKTANVSSRSCDDRNSTNQSYDTAKQNY